MATKQAVRIGVVGAGYWGPKLVHNVREMDEAELVAVCDLSEERLGTLKAQYPDLNTITDFRELLRDPSVDALVIATPIRTHYRIALQALNAGKHVLVEKPLTASVAESEALVEAAAAADRRLMVGHTFQYNPAVEKLRDLVQGGALGEVLYVDCARLNLGLFQGDINVVWDLAPHDIAILLHVLGSLPVGVSAYGADHVMKGIDDTAHLTLRFANGVDAHVRLSWLDPHKERRVSVVGSKKMAVFDDTAAQKLTVYDRRVALRGTDLMNRPLFDYHDGAVETPEIAEVEPLRVQLRHFIHCIRSGDSPTSDGRVGMEVVRVLEAADASRAADGRWIELRSAPPSLVKVFQPLRLESNVDVAIAAAG